MPCSRCGVAVPCPGRDSLGSGREHTRSDTGERRGSCYAGVITGLIFMRVFLALPALAAAALSASAVRADGFYVAGALDGVFPQGGSTTINQVRDPYGNQVNNNGVPVPYQVQRQMHPQAGGEVDAAAGYRFGLGRWGGLRAEGEFSFRDSRAGDYTLQSLPGQVYGTDFRADYRTTKGLYDERYGETANLFYDLPQFGFATPYVGAGVGYEETVNTPGERLEQYQDSRYATGSIFGPTPTSSGAVTRRIASNASDDGTWQVEAGVSLAMTAHLSLVPAYRYSRLFNGSPATHLVRLGLRYSF